MNYGMGDVAIDSSPRGAYIYIDTIPLLDSNRNAVLTPTVVSMAEGLHEIRIALDGYYEKQIIINVIPNKINNIKATLTSIYY